MVLDGRATTFAAPCHRSILDGAQQARPDLPYACKGGVCGTCRALVTDGDADMRRNYALEPAEVHRLLRLRTHLRPHRATAAGEGAGYRAQQGRPRSALQAAPKSV